MSDRALREPDGRTRHIGRYVCWLGYWLLLALATHLPSAGKLGPSIPGIDKVAHFFMSMLLALLGMWAWVLAKPGRRIQRLAIWTCLLLVYTMLDECSQPLTGRDAELGDWLADVAGCGVGLLIGWRLWFHR